MEYTEFKPRIAQWNSINHLSLYDLSLTRFDLYMIILREFSEDDQRKGTFDTFKST